MPDHSAFVDSALGFEPSSVVVTHPGGTVGGRLASTLLEAGEAVTLVSRSAKSLDHLVEQGAHYIRVANPSGMRAALMGARGLVWITHAGELQDDPVGLVRRARQTAALAAAAAVRVVVLSVSGPLPPRPSSRAVALRDIERAFQTCCDTVVVRAGLFFDDLAEHAPALRGTGGVIPVLFPVHEVAPLVAIADVVETICTELIAPPSLGPRTVEVVAPQTLTWSQMGLRLGMLLERAVEIRTGTAEQVVEYWRDLGLSPERITWLATTAPLLLGAGDPDAEEEVEIVRGRYLLSPRQATRHQSRPRRPLH